MRLRVSAIVLLSFACIASGCAPAPVTTVVLVRHAERLNSTDTTSLSPAGLQRAAALRHTLDSAGIEAVFVTDKLRTKQTADSLRIAHGLTEVRLPATDTQRLVDSLRARAGQKILVVGHSDTLPKIIDAFGIAPPQTIAGNEFDKMFILTLHSGGGRLVRLQYGERSP